MWWLRGSDWICGGEHPDPQNPEMLKREVFYLADKIKLPQDK
jgi:hypothetical protein